MSDIGLLLGDDSFKSLIIFFFMIILIIVLVRSLFYDFPDEEEDRVIKDKSKQNDILIESTDFIYYKDFLKDWIIDRTMKQGYRYEKKPGVYVILIFNKRVRGGNFYNYRDVYVGQSKTMANRVHNHLIGKGNGDVYADVKYGKYVYIQLNYCNYGEMNDLEKKLIKKYNAQESYNNTKGGGIERVNPD